VDAYPFGEILRQRVGNFDGEHGGSVLRPERVFPQTEPLLRGVALFCTSRLGAASNG
jgi:hypothetical protein